MASKALSRALTDIGVHRRALLKFISANNVGATGSHECGYFLPKAAWQLYSPHPPIDGQNREHPVSITWPDGRVTESCVKWYGNATRSEYRLTRFGRDFPWLTPANIGNLLILIPVSGSEFIAHVLTTESDIEGLQAALNVHILRTWATFGTEPDSEQATQKRCMDTAFAEAVATFDHFPPTTQFSKMTLEVVQKCIRDFSRSTLDRKLLTLVESEYRLFKLAEDHLCKDELLDSSRSTETFLRIANSMMNRRKARAGKSLENHVEWVFGSCGLSFEMQPTIDGQPDMILPNKRAYDDPDFPTERLVVLAMKTTCKDRWRQVLNEARRIKRKHLLTLQPGISGKQLDAMWNSGIQLVVPKSLHSKYPKESSMRLLSVSDFVEFARKLSAK